MNYLEIGAILGGIGFVVAFALKYIQKGRRKAELKEAKKRKAEAFQRIRKAVADRAEERAKADAAQEKRERAERDAERQKEAARNVSGADVGAALDDELSK